MNSNQQKIYRFQFSAENTNNEELTRFCISCHIGTVLIFDIVFDKEKQIMNTLLKRILTGVNFLPSYVVIILVNLTIRVVHYISKSKKRCTFIVTTRS